MAEPINSKTNTIQGRGERRRGPEAATFGAEVAGGSVSGCTALEDAAALASASKGVTLDAVSSTGARVDDAAPVEAG
jgi:hypothetical protein